MQREHPKVRLLKAVEERAKKEEFVVYPNDTAWLPMMFPAVFSATECAAVLQEAAKLEVRDGGIRQENAQTEVRRSQVQWIAPFPETEWIYARMEQVVNQANQHYKYDLVGFLEGLQVATYHVGGHYGWHLDVGPGLSLRKLSIVVQLSSPEDYDGGGLEIHRLPISPREIGTMIVFPSYMTHRVNAVTRGTRKSLVAWISGPPFR